MDAYRFPRHVRLLTAGDYRYVFDHVVCKASNPVFLLLATRQTDTAARLGIIVAKKNVKKAVQRNRIKRIVRETFRHRQSHLDPLDIIVLARKGADELSNEQLSKQLNKLMVRLEQRKHQTAPGNQNRSSDRRAGNG